LTLLATVSEVFGQYTRFGFTFDDGKPLSTECAVTSEPKRSYDLFAFSGSCFDTTLNLRRYCITWQNFGKIFDTDQKGLFFKLKMLFLENRLLTPPESASSKRRVGI